MSSSKPSRYGSKAERSQYEKELRQRNPEYAERQRQNTRDWVNRNRARKRQKNKDYHNSGRYREAFLKRWGLSTKDEPSGCHICGCPPGDRSLALDHDHISGEARGFLCQQCNIALGHFKDNVDLLQRAIDYLRNPPLNQRQERLNP